MPSEQTTTEASPVPQTWSIWTRVRLQPSQVECGAAIICSLLALTLIWPDILGPSVGTALLPLLAMAGAALGLAWILRLTVVVLHWSRRKRDLLNHKLAWILLPLLASLLLLAFVTRNTGAIPFDGPRWKTVAEGSRDTIRWRMVEDLRNNHLSQGMSRTKVLTLLGSPDRPTWGAGRASWWLRPAPNSRASSLLELRFGPQGLEGSSIQEK